MRERCNTMNERTEWSAGRSEIRRKECSGVKKMNEIDIMDSIGGRQTRDGREMMHNE